MKTRLYKEDISVIKDSIHSLCKNHLSPDISKIKEDVFYPINTEFYGDIFSIISTIKNHLLKGYIYQLETLFKKCFDKSQYNLIHIKIRERNQEEGYFSMNSAKYVLEFLKSNFFENKHEVLEITTPSDNKVLQMQCRELDEYLKYLNYNAIIREPTLLANTFLRNGGHYCTAYEASNILHFIEMSKYTKYFELIFSVFGEKRLNVQRKILDIYISKAKFQSFYKATEAEVQHLNDYVTELSKYTHLIHFIQEEESDEDEQD